MPPESASTGESGRPLMAYCCDAAARVVGGGAPVDEEARRAAVGEDEVLGDREPLDEALLEPAGGQVADTAIEAGAVVLRS